MTITLSAFNLLSIALWVDLSWNIMTFGGNGDFKISLASIASIDSELNWPTDRALCDGTNRNFLRIVGLGDEWCSLQC